MIVAFLMIRNKQPSPPYQESCIGGLAKEQLRVDRVSQTELGNGSLARWLAGRDRIESEDLIRSKERLPNASKIAVTLFTS